MAPKNEREAGDKDCEDMANDGLFELEDDDGAELDEGRDIDGVETMK
jgi:hypothetical protein